MVSTESIKRALKKFPLYTNLALVFTFLKVAGWLPNTKSMNVIFMIVITIGIVTTLIWIFLQFSEQKTRY